MENKQIPTVPKRPIPQKPIIQNQMQKPIPQKPIIQKPIAEKVVNDEGKDKVEEENKKDVKVEVEKTKPEIANTKERKAEEEHLKIEKSVPQKANIIQKDSRTEPKEKLNTQSRAILFGLLGGLFMVAGVVMFVLMLI